MQSKNAIGNLKNCYIAVLKKCNLLNTFGSLAIASMLVIPSLALADNPSGVTLNTTQGVTAQTQNYTNDGTINIENVPPSPYFIGIYGNDSFQPSKTGGETEGYNFTNSATGVINVGGVVNSSGGIGSGGSGNTGSGGSGDNSFLVIPLNPGAPEGERVTIEQLITFEKEFIPFYEAEGTGYTDAEKEDFIKNANEIIKNLISNGDNLDAIKKLFEGIPGAGDITDPNNIFSSLDIFLYKNVLNTVLEELLKEEGKLTENESLPNNFNITNFRDLAYFLPESQLRDDLMSGAIDKIEYYGMLIGNSHNIDPYGQNVDNLLDNAPLRQAAALQAPVNHTLTNLGRISVNGFGNFVGGMAIFADGNQTITNSGTTNVYNFLGTAGGLIASSYADGSHNISNNHGELNVHVENSDGAAYAIFARSDNGSHTASNDYGVINVLVDSSTSQVNLNAENVRTDRVQSDVVGIYTLSSEGAHNVSNISGNISVTNNSLNGDAVGIYLHGSLQQGEYHTLSSTGFITAQANGAGRQFEVYGDQDYYVENYAVTQRVTDPAANRPQYSATDAVFGASEDAQVLFDENTTIIVRPEVYTHNGVQYYTEVNTNAYNNYVPLGTLVSTFDNIEKYVQGDFYINGIIGSENFVTEVPFLIIDAPDIILADSSLSSLDTNQPSFRLLANTENLPTAFTLTANSAIATQLYNAYVGLKPSNFYFAISLDDSVANSDLSGMPAGSQSVMAEDMMPSPWSVFGALKGSYTDNNEYNFNSKSFGAGGGANYAFSEQLSLGFHFDYTYTDTGSNIAAGSTLDSEMNSVAFGLHSTYNIDSNWYVRAMMTGAYSHSNLDYAASPTIKTTTDTESTSFYTALAAGYTFEINENNFIIPEVGLSYLYTDTSEYDFNFSAPNEIYNMRMHSSNFDALYANFLVSWEGIFAAGNGIIMPSIGVGISQNLTGSDVDSSITLLGNTYSTIASQDDTSLLANASLEWRNGNFSVSASYDGTFGNDQQTHAGSLNVMYRF